MASFHLRNFLSKKARKLSITYKNIDTSINSTESKDTTTTAEATQRNEFLRRVHKNNIRATDQDGFEVVGKGTVEKDMTADLEKKIEDEWVMMDGHTNEGKNGK